MAMMNKGIAGIILSHKHTHKDIQALDKIEACHIIATPDARRQTPAKSAQARLDHT